MSGPNDTRVFEISYSEQSRSAVDTTSVQQQDFVSEFNLLTHWDEYGDVVENAVEISDIGSEIALGARYNTQIVDGTVETTELSRVFDSQQRRVGMNEMYGTYPVEHAGKICHWESYHLHNTRGWEPGWYTASFVVRDLHRNAISKPVMIEFELR